LEKYRQCTPASKTKSRNTTKTTSNPTSTGTRSKPSGKDTRSEKKGPRRVHNEDKENQSPTWTKKPCIVFVVWQHLWSHNGRLTATIKVNTSRAILLEINCYQRFKGPLRNFLMSARSLGVYYHHYCISRLHLENLRISGTNK
jgi:hypothetical protein